MIGGSYSNTPYKRDLHTHGKIKPDCAGSQSHRKCNPLVFGSAVFLPALPLGDERGLPEILGGRGVGQDRFVALALPRLHVHCRRLIVLAGGAVASSRLTNKMQQFSSYAIQPGGTEGISGEQMRAGGRGGGGGKLFAGVFATATRGSRTKPATNRNKTIKSRKQSYNTYKKPSSPFTNQRRRETCPPREHDLLVPSPPPVVISRA